MGRIQSSDRSKSRESDKSQDNTRKTIKEKPEWTRSTSKASDRSIAPSSIKLCSEIIQIKHQLEQHHTNLQAGLRAVGLLSLARSVLGTTFTTDRLSFSARHDDGRVEMESRRDEKVALNKRREAKRDEERWRRSGKWETGARC